MKKHINKILSWLLVVCMLFGSAPANVWASELETTEESVVEVQTEETSETNQETASTEAADPNEAEEDAETAQETVSSTNSISAFSMENEGVAAQSLTMGTKPADGTTTGNPFVKGTGGSNSFRIPAMVTLNNGTIVAAADARWNTTYDGGGLDTIVSYSTDNGANWNYTFANYLGDNGNTYNGSGSTAFIDPALATDGQTVYMLTDLYPYGVALNGSDNTAPSTAVGFNSDGTLKLAANGSSTYNYYLKDGQIYDSSNNVVSEYTVDAYFNITGNGYDTNLFFSDSPYQVVRTGYLYLTKSTDGGKTWSEPTLIPNVKTSSEQVCLVGPGRGLVTSKGTIIFPVYSYNGSSESQRMGFIYSTDSGVTWTRVSDATSSMWSSEAAVVELNDGTLRFFYRNGKSSLYYVDYNMSSSSWGSPVNTDIATNSNTQISAIKYSKTVDGKEVILVSCPTGSNGNGSADSSASARLNGKIFVGYVNSDNSMSWQSDKAVSVTSNNSQFMYSCLTELSDGKVAILYENQESAWGTGDSCYYTMDFQIYDLGLTVDSENTGTENGSTITDETTQTVVTAPSDIDLTSIKVETATVDGITGRDYVAYNITLNDGAYTGSAEVSIALPDNMKELKENQLTGFTVNANGSLTFTEGKLKDGVYTFTASHFSVQGVLSLADIIETNVELYVGESEEFADKTGNYENNYTTPNEQIATMTVKGEDGQPAGVTYNEASVTCNDLISSNSSSWKAASGYYYTPDGTNYYPVYAKRSSSGWIIKNYTYTWGYFDTNSSSDVTKIDTQSTTSTSITPNITVYTQSTTDPVSASTTITFTGVAAGETTAIVGKTQYNILVKRKTETVSISVGGTATYTDSTAAYGVTNSDSSVVKTEVEDGKITFTGLKDGTATVTTAGVEYNVTVSEIPPYVNMETTPFVSGTGDYSGKKVTKLTTSVNKNYDLNLSISGSNITWTSNDTNIVTVDQNGIVTGKSAGETTVTCTVDGTTYIIPIVVLADNYGGNYDYICDLYVAEITSTTVKYSINEDTDLLEAQEGEAIYLGFDYPFCINFFGREDDGYALTYMSSTNSANNYYALYEVSQLSDLDAYNKGAIYYQRTEVADWSSKVNTLLNLVIDDGYHGTMGWTRSKNNGNISSSLTFRSEKLPTVSKKVTTVNGETYTEGMIAHVGDKVIFEVTVTQYAAEDSITYSSVTLTDNLLGAIFTKNSSNTMSLSLSNEALSEDKVNTYQVEYTITDKDLDTTVVNTVDLSYTYKAAYSSGSFSETASDNAKFTAASFNPKDIVIDFGLPVEIDYSGENDHGRYNLNSGQATYGDVSVIDNKVTYTPDTMLKDIDTVTLTNEKGGIYTFKVYPATTVYYEEGFATLSGFSVGSKGTGTQKASIVGSQNHYGYDAKYAAETKGSSNGTEAVSNAKGSTAEFSFTGTGVDIFANCAPDTGNVMVQLFKADGTLVKLMTIQTAATGAYGGKVSTGAYNSVIASVKGLQHGSYKLKITITSEGKDVRLDGFRVYGTLEDEATNAAYASDLEENPTFFNMRDAVLTALKVNGEKSSADIYAQVFEKIDGKIDGAVVLSDAKLNSADDAETLLKEGPKKEIYLKSGQALVFKVNTTRKLELGLKAVNDPVTFTVNGTSQTITSDTDMFYEITKTENGTVAVTNTSDAILAVTNLKICDDPDAAFAELNEDDFNDALIALGIVEAPSEPEVSYADAILNITLNDESGAALAATALTANGVVGETATFAAADIEAAVAGLVPEGYELTDASYSDVDVAYGDEDEVVFKASVKETENETEEETEPAEEPEQPSNIWDKIVTSIKDFFKGLFGK